MARTKTKPLKMKKEKTPNKGEAVEKPEAAVKKRRADKQGRKMLRCIKRAQQSAELCIPRAVSTRSRAPPLQPQLMLCAGTEAADQGGSAAD